MFRWLPVLLATLAFSACGGGANRGGAQAPIQRVDVASPSTSGLKQGSSLRTRLVKTGETLYAISFEMGVDINDLVAWNGLSDKSRIRAGQTLLIEPPAAPIGEAGKGAGVGRTGALGATSGRMSGESVPSKAPLPAVKVPVAVASGWNWPVQGRVVRGFNPRRGSKGLDIVAEEGSLINAAAAGEVVYAGHGLRGYGNLIILKHNATTLSAYAHQSRLIVSEGQQVLRGQPIGEMGSTDAERIKLHFQIREFGKPVDPRAYLPKA